MDLHLFYAQQDAALAVYNLLNGLLNRASSEFDELIKTFPQDDLSDAYMHHNKLDDAACKLIMGLDNLIDLLDLLLSQDKIREEDYDDLHAFLDETCDVVRCGVDLVEEELTYLIDDGYADDGMEEEVMDAMQNNILEIAESNTVEFIDNILEQIKEVA